jgi:hypothetical protein
VFVWDGTITADSSTCQPAVAKCHVQEHSSPVSEQDSLPYNFLSLPFLLHSPLLAFQQPSFPDAADYSESDVKYKYGLNTILAIATPDCEAGKGSFSKHTFTTFPHFLNSMTDDNKDRLSSGILRGVGC